MKGRACSVDVLGADRVMHTDVKDPLVKLRGIIGLR